LHHQQKVVDAMRIKYVQQVTNEISLGIIKTLHRLPSWDDNKHRGDRMRAFFGLSPDTNTKLAIDNWRNTAFAHLDGPVPAANFHVTLAFLGNVSANQLATINRLIDTMPSVTAFDVSLNKLGYWAKPKAFWLGCQQTANEHLKLAKQTHKIANEAGLMLQDQDYVAHLTLARKCKVDPPAPLFPANFKWHADQFHLFESTSSPPGPLSQESVEYVIRQSWPMLKQCGCGA
jgi:2'-5' RNA ligase